MVDGRKNSNILRNVSRETIGEAIPLLGGDTIMGKKFVVGRFNREGCVLEYLVSFDWGMGNTMDNQVWDADISHGTRYSERQADSLVDHFVSVHFTSTFGIKEVD